MIPAWNAAFIYDTEAGAAAAEDIVEFANSQLLQFRYYDQLLDVELGKLYDELQKERRPSCSEPGATRAPRGRCTRCSSISASCSTGPRTR